MRTEFIQKQSPLNLMRYLQKKGITLLNKISNK
jgi:hypothetical protein